MTILTLSNLVALSLQLAAIAGAALLALRLLRIEAPAVRYVLLRGALAICLALPLLQPWQPFESGPDRPGITAAVADARVAADGAPDAGGGAAALPDTWTTVLVVVLLAGVFARLAWVGAGVARLRTLRRAGEVSPATGEHEDLLRVIGTRAAIRYVAGLGQPVTFGFRHPVVLLPLSLQAHTPGIRRAVIAHELWHVRRRDWMWTVVEESVRAAFWFHPLMWMLLSAIQSTREEVVDELSILSTGSRRSYIDALLAYADASPLFAANAFARRRHLVHRMVLISKEAVMSARHVVASSAAVAASVLAAGWLGVQAFPLVQEPGAGPFNVRPGPVEQRARPVTAENPVPRRLHHVPADYPGEAASVGARGSVDVILTLDETGHVAESRAVRMRAAFDGQPGMFQFRAPGDLQRMVTARYPGLPADRVTAYVQALTAMAASAVRAVNAWTYAPPADGPISFGFHVGVPAEDGEPAPPPPPPPPPPPTQPAVQERPGWPAGDGALRVGGNIKPPTKIRNVNPVYPEDAKAQKIQGVVIVEARIEPDGLVSDTRILRSIPMLDAAAVEAVRQWEFTPTWLNGEAVPVIMTVTVNFTLQ
jgi:TonB family protein